MISLRDWDWVSSWLWSWSWFWSWFWFRAWFRHSSRRTSTSASAPSGGERYPAPDGRDRTYAGRYCASSNGSRLLSRRDLDLFIDRDACEYTLQIGRASCRERV